MCSSAHTRLHAFPHMLHEANFHRHPARCDGSTHVRAHVDAHVCTHVRTPLHAHTSAHTSTHVPARIPYAADLHEHPARCDGGSRHRPRPAVRRRRRPARLCAPVLVTAAYRGISATSLLRLMSTRRSRRLRVRTWNFRRSVRWSVRWDIRWNVPWNDDQLDLRRLGYCRGRTITAAASVATDADSSPSASVRTWNLR